MKKNLINLKKISIFILFFTLLLTFISSLYFSKVYVFILLLIILVCSCSIFYFYNKEIVNLYFKDVKLEFNNINWVDKSDLRQTAFIIVLIIFFTSLFLWIIDSILTYIVSKFI